MLAATARTQSHCAHRRDEHFAREVRDGARLVLKHDWR
jgi:hypothetical protein